MAESPREVWRLARELLDRRAGELAGRWPRAVALLARQALEHALHELWRRKAPSLVDCSTRAQLLCLPSYLPDDAKAHDASLVWQELSAACHHRPYDLGPTWAELDAFVLRVGGVLDAVDAAVR